MASEAAASAAAAEEVLQPLSSKAGQLLDKMSAVFSALDPQVRGRGWKGMGEEGPGWVGGTEERREGGGEGEEGGREGGREGGALDGANCKRTCVWHPLFP
jgi:hypothetical protein